MYGTMNVLVWRGLLANVLAFLRHNLIPAGHMLTAAVAETNLTAEAKTKMAPLIKYA